MPDRILRDITDSDRYNAVGPNERDLFIRLLNKADDFACYVGDTKRLKPALYPLLLDSIREADLARWIRSLETAGLVRLYEVADRQYVFICRWRQRARAEKRKFPMPPWGPGDPDDGQAPVNCPADDGPSRPYSGSGSYSSSETGSGVANEKTERKPAWRTRK